MEGVMGDKKTTTAGGGDTAMTQHGAIMRRFALFMDGMARAVILPFGPALVYRLVYGTTTTTTTPESTLDDTQWSLVAFFLAMLVSVYIVGRWLGTTLTDRVSDAATPHSRLAKHVARLGGALLSLHIFAYGAGLSSVRVLFFIRFLSATLAGMLCGITRSIQLPEDGRVSFHQSLMLMDKCSNDEERALATRRREGYVDIASGTANIYLMGFAVSILSGGLLFRSATKDSTFQALTGAYQYSWSPLFLVAVWVVTEIVLRRVFSWASETTPAMSSLLSPIESNGSIQQQLDTPLSFSLSNSFHKTIAEEGSESDPGFVFHDPFVYGSSSVRSRNDSYTSMDDDFYDCRSVFSDSEHHTAATGGGLRALSPIHLSSTNYQQQQYNHHVSNEEEDAQYRHRKCVYADGTPAFVPPGNCVATVPENYLKFYNHDMTRAQKAWAATQKWRLERHVWRIHTMSNTWFTRIKEAYPHFVHGHSKAGYPIIYEQPGKMNLKELFRSGCDIADMVTHYIFFMEFISNYISTRDDIRSIMGVDAPAHNSSSWGTMVVMDIQGAGLSHLSGDVVKYLKQAGDINTQHYPLTMKRAFLVNSPFWLAGAWSGLKNILPESVQVDILSAAKYPSALREYIDEDQIPPEYGGTSPFKLGEHPYEVQLEELVDEAANGKENEQDEENVAALTSAPLIVQVSPNKVPAAPFDESFTMATSPILGTPPNVQPVRRRVASVDRIRRLSYSKGIDYYNGNKVLGGEIDVFVIVSLAHCVWSAVQGAIESAIPLWILSPTSVGGLGYSPSRSGVSMFCACLTLLWILRAKSSRLVSRIPSKAPLRALRIGAGSKSMLFALLGYVASSSDASERRDSPFVMASTIILFACIALASMLGRSACKILHRIAAEWYARQAKPQQGSFLTIHYSMARFVNDCETGRLTAALNITFEVVGSLLFATMWSWSVSKGRPPPFDGTSIFFVSSLATFLLYVGSFSLHLNAAGEFAPHPNDKGRDSSIRRCFQFVGEVVAVSAGDLASLLEEAKWRNSSVVLGRVRSRTFSDATTRNDFMERGKVI